MQILALLYGQFKNTARDSARGHKVSAVDLPRLTALSVWGKGQL